MDQSRLWTEPFGPLRVLMIMKGLPDSSIMFEGLTDGDGWTTHTALSFGQHINFGGK